MTNDFETVLQYIEAELGFATSFYNDSYIDRRLTARLRRTDTNWYAEYRDVLDEDPDERVAELDANAGEFATAEVRDDVPTGRYVHRGRVDSGAQPGELFERRGRSLGSLVCEAIERPEGLDVDLHVLGYAGAAGLAGGRARPGVRFRSTARPADTAARVTVVAHRSASSIRRPGRRSAKADPVRGVRASTDRRPTRIDSDMTDRDSR